MLKTVKVRLYPPKEQKESLAKAMGSTRWLWNYYLDLTNKTYKDTGKGLNRGQLQSLLPELKKQEETEWLSETYSQCLQVVALNLSNAFINFFERRASYPRFKSKHGKQSLSYPQNVKIVGDCLKFPKLGLIYAKIHREIKGSIKTVTITKNSCDQYYASILFEDGTKKPIQSIEGNAIGIDLGLTHFAITSDGSKFDNPRWIKKYERNLKIKQQQLSRKQKGSNNRNKSRKKVAKVHNKITRCREDFHHKLSRRIVNENQVIVVENLAVRNMVRNRSLSKAISQVGWGQFCTMLKYKAENEGKVYLEVDRFFASSKTCNNCLYQVSDLLLDLRFWDCPSCGTKHIDRDINAARNIRDEGLRILTSGTGDKAYCPDVRPKSRGRKKSTIGRSVG
ncbi:transposase [Pleurocapsales cyanobacterium LEGE 06147]|nr:transposase [Pleurocapsales cyanobacterium LEGE 06147]